MRRGCLSPFLADTVKFHNLRGGGEIPHRFYEMEGRGANRIVRLSLELRRITASEHLAGLGDELDGRWNIVEISFTTGMGREA